MTHLTVLFASICLALLTGCDESDEEFIERYAQENECVSFHRAEHENLATLLIHDQQKCLDDVLPRLKNIGRLSVLRIRKVSINSASLQMICESSTEYLVLTTCSIDADTLPALSAKSKIKKITVRDVSEKFVASLSVLDELQELDLTGAEVTGSGFESVEFPGLERLNLTGCPVTDDDLVHIAKLNLKWLGVGQTEVTGPGLLTLATMHSLEEVWTPDGISNADGIAAGELHLEQKRNARRAGADVPSDSISPFSAYEHAANQELIHERNVKRQADRNMPWPDARQLGLLESRLIRLIGRDNAMSVYAQVDEHINNRDSIFDYVNDERTLAQILTEDFEARFDPLPVDLYKGEITPPEQWGTLPEKAFRHYLSGKMDEALVHSRLND